MNYTPTLDGTEMQNTLETRSGWEARINYRIFVSDLASSEQHTSKCSMFFAICAISDKFETEVTLWAMLPLMWVESSVSSDYGNGQLGALKGEGDFLPC